MNSFKDIIYCVRWDLNGGRLASLSADKTAKILDFADEKIYYSGRTPDESNLFSDLLLD